MEVTHGIPMTDSKDWRVRVDTNILDNCATKPLIFEVAYKNYQRDVLEADVDTSASDDAKQEDTRQERLRQATHTTTTTTTTKHNKVPVQILKYNK